MNPLFFLDFRHAAAIGAVNDRPAVSDENDTSVGEPAAALSALPSGTARQPQANEMAKVAADALAGN